MQCTNPFDLKVEDRTVVVPCGHCTSCRIARTREWYIRLFHESLGYEKACFTTLTYDDEIRKVNYVYKWELQNFIKRLRHDVEGLKYFGVGEYGEKTGRPHYHAILFGVGCRNKVVERNWNYGFVKNGSVTIDSLRYVAGYVQKKLYGKESGDYEYQPFAIMSRGIGKDFALKNERSIRERGYVSVNGVRSGIPRYYAKVLGIENFEWNESEKVYEDYKDFWDKQAQRAKVVSARLNFFKKGIV